MAQTVLLELPTDGKAIRDDLKREKEGSTCLRERERKKG